MLVVSYNGILSWRFGSHEILVLIQVSNIITKDILSEDLVSNFFYKHFLSEDMVSKCLTKIFYLKIWSVNFFQTYSF